MLDLLGRIDQAGQTTKSSFTDFQGCSIATMILLIAGILERDLCYEARLSFGLSCLRRMAGEHIAAINGVHFMEALKAITDEAAEKLRKSIATETRDAPYVAPAVSIQNPQAAPLTSAHVVSTSTPAPWDHTGQILALSLPPALHDTWFERNGNSWTNDQHDAGDPFSLLQFDNEAFLMELTDLDVPGNSGS